uniref:Myosin_tail_1 domain-containing protein n=1 Tax=Echinostoma caproni TaxID=27848 RepID=A0A183AQD7_9TREM
LEQCNLIIGELRASLAETQTHLRGVEAELSETLASRQEAEARLSAIHSILRRLLGFRQSQYASRLGLRTDADASGTEGPEDTEDEKSRKSGGAPRETDPMNGAEMRARHSEEFENEWELRRIAERILQERARHPSSGGTVAPKPRQRMRRQPDQDQEVYLSPSLQLRSSQAAKRSKSMSPSRDKKDPLPERSNSNERQPDARFSFHEGRYHDSINLGDLDAIDFPARWLQTMRQHLNGARYRGLPGSDLDPEAVRMLLRDFLRHLVQIERERDSNEMNLRAREEQLADLHRQLSDYEQKVHHLQQTLGGIERGKSEVMEQVSSMKSVISEQESLMLKRDRDLDDMRDKMVLLERQLAVCEAEKQQLQIRMDKAKTSESRLEEDRRQLLRGLDDAETRYTQAEVARRRLEGELHRMQTAMNDLESEKQALQCRLENLARQNSELEARVHALQADVDRLTQALNQANQMVNELRDHVDRDQKDQMSLKQELNEQREMIAQLQKRESANDQERRLLEERLESNRTSLNQTKSRLHETLERLQELQLETSDGVLQRSELETQLRQLANMSAENQQTQSELQTRLATLQNEHTTVVEKNAELLRSLNDLGLEKHELECELTRTRKEQAQWKKTAERVDRERLREQDACTKLRTESTELGKTIRRLEEENLDLRRDLQKLQLNYENDLYERNANVPWYYYVQAHVAQQEDTQAARLIEVNTKQRLENEAEMERQRLALAQAEKVIQQKERSHRQRVRGLEEQVALLKDQLSQEMNRRQLFLSRSQNLASYTSPSQPNLLNVGTATTEPELGDIRSPLDISLPQETYLPGLYKPTIAPSRYDPYYYQVTGSIPSQLDRSYGSGSGRYSRDRDSGIVNRIGQGIPSPAGLRASTSQTMRGGESVEARHRSMGTPGSNTGTDTTTTGQSSGSKVKDSPSVHIPSRYMTTTSLNRSTSESTIRRKES